MQVISKWSLPLAKTWHNQCQVRAYRENGTSVITHTCQPLVYVNRNTRSKITSSRRELSMLTQFSSSTERIYKRSNFNLATFPNVTSTMSTTTTMRAVVYEKPFSVVIRDVEKPRIEHPDDVIVKSALCLVFDIVSRLTSSIVTTSCICGRYIHYLVFGARVCSECRT